MGTETLILRNANNPTDIIHALQEAIKPHKKWHDSTDKEPFDILIETLSDVVKWHLVTGGKQYITRDYVVKLEETLSQWKPIDLRTQNEKIVISNWKEKYSEKKNDEHSESDEHKEDHHH